MTIGFSKSTITKIIIPDKPPPFPIYDDCTLAFFTGFRNKIMWYLLNRKNDHYKIFRIPKSNGRVRLIHAPTPLMRNFSQQLHARLLLPLCADLGDHVTAYRPKRSITQAVQRHIPPCATCDSAPKGEVATKHACPRDGAFIQMDLKNFFTNTRRTWIRQYFEDIGFSFYVSGLLANLMTVPVKNPKGKPGSQYWGTPHQEFFHGVPQGAPTSGAICNLIANHKLDQRILAYLDTLNKRDNLEPPWNWVYSRYADDLTFTCGKDYPRYQKQRIVQTLTGIIHANHYTVNTRKTRITSAYYRRQLLGTVANKKPNIAYTEYWRVKAMLHNSLVQGVDTQYERAGKKSPEEYLQYLRGKVAFIRQVNPERGDKLRVKLDAATTLWNEAQHAIS